MPLSLPKGPSRRFEASREVWILALLRVTTHVSHPWTSLELKSVEVVDSHGTLLALSSGIHAC